MKKNKTIDWVIGWILIPPTIIIMLFLALSQFGVIKTIQEDAASRKQNDLLKIITDENLPTIHASTNAILDNNGNSITLKGDTLKMSLLSLNSDLPAGIFIGTLIADYKSSNGKDVLPIGTKFLGPAGYNDKTGWTLIAGKIVSPAGLVYKTKDADLKLSVDNPSLHPTSNIKPGTIVEVFVTGN